MNNIPTEDRPRERLLKYGANTLSTAELIAVILGSGTKENPVLKLSHEIITHFGSLNRLAEATVEEFCQIKGVGPAKAIQLRASLSLGMRAIHQGEVNKFRIESPTQAYNLLKGELENEKRELFMVILLDVRGCVINHQVISIGTLTKALVHPREVFYPAIRHKAAGMILAHNHPSGDPNPSHEDFEITKRLIAVGKLMGIPVNDHIIIAQQGYVSLREKGVFE